MKKPKSIPIRQCLGCNEHFPKSELVRVLRAPDGSVMIDVTGKKSGRGAYICKDQNCLKKALKSKRIDKTLECTVPEELYSEIAESLARELEGAKIGD